MTELHDASKAGNLNKCRRLIEHGADVDAKDEYGCTPLHWAAVWGHLKICELLIKNGAVVNAKQISTFLASCSGVYPRIKLYVLLLDHNLDFFPSQTPGIFDHMIKHDLLSDIVSVISKHLRYKKLCMKRKKRWWWYDMIRLNKRLVFLSILFIPYMIFGEEPFRFVFLSIWFTIETPRSEEEPLDKKTQNRIRNNRMFFHYTYHYLKEIIKHRHSNRICRDLSDPVRIRVFVMTLFEWTDTKITHTSHRSRQMIRGYYEYGYAPNRHLIGHRSLIRLWRPSWRFQMKYASLKEDHSRQIVLKPCNDPVATINTDFESNTDFGLGTHNLFSNF